MRRLLAVDVPEIKDLNYCQSYLKNVDIDRSEGMTQLQLNPNNGMLDIVSQQQTTQQQRAQLEALLYEKVEQGQDISSCVQALDYLNSKDKTQDQLQKMWTEVVRERSVFNTLQRVVFTAFAILGMIAILNGAFKSARPTHALILPPVDVERQ